MEGLAQKIPDVWFDLYARLIPGTLLVTGTYLVSGTLRSGMPDPSPIWLLVLGYFAGHFLQPLSSTLGKFIEYQVGTAAASAKIPSNVNASGREMLIISKQHAETVGMAANSLACLVILAIQNFDLTPIVSAESPDQVDAIRFEGWFLATLCAMFLVFAIERANTARKRCERLWSPMELPPSLATSSKPPGCRSDRGALLALGFVLFAIIALASLDALRAC